MLIWLAGAGFIAECIATGPPRTPYNDNEVPWPGGVARYRQIIPIVVVYETAEPVQLTFERGLNQATGLHLYMLRSGLTDVPEDMATGILKVLRRRPSGAAPLPKITIPQPDT
jgi:hypothetical protein